MRMGTGCGSVVAAASWRCAHTYAMRRGADRSTGPRWHSGRPRHAPRAASLNRLPPEVDLPVVGGRAGHPVAKRRERREVEAVSAVAARDRIVARDLASGRCAAGCRWATRLGSLRLRRGRRQRLRNAAACWLLVWLAAHACRPCLPPTLAAHACRPRLPPTLAAHDGTTPRGLPAPPTTPNASHALQRQNQLWRAAAARLFEQHVARRALLDVRRQL